MRLTCTHFYFLQDLGLVHEASALSDDPLCLLIDFCVSLERKNKQPVVRNPTSAYFLEFLSNLLYSSYLLPSAGNNNNGGWCTRVFFVECFEGSPLGCWRFWGSGCGISWGDALGEQQQICQTARAKAG